jgi:hypothetical protein
MQNPLPKSDAKIKRILLPAKYLLGFVIGCKKDQNHIDYKKMHIFATQKQNEK